MEMLLKMGKHNGKRRRRRRNGSLDGEVLFVVVFVLQIVQFLQHRGEEELNIVINTDIAANFLTKRNFCKIKIFEMHDTLL